MLVLEAERGSHKASTTGSNEKQVCVDKVPCLGFSLVFKDKLIACELLRKKIGMRKHRLWLKAVLEAGGVFPEAAADQAQNVVVCWTRVRLISGSLHLVLDTMGWRFMRGDGISTQPAMRRKK